MGYRTDLGRGQSARLAASWSDRYKQSMRPPGIVLVSGSPLPADELRRLVGLYFEDIRPAHANRSMEIQDPATRQRVRELTFALIGEGEPLA